jgi:hypothetical protein
MLVHVQHGVCCGCETWSSTFREEQKLKIVENRRVARQWRKSYYIVCIIMLRRSGKIVWVEEFRNAHHILLCVT